MSWQPIDTIPKGAYERVLIYVPSPHFPSGRVYLTWTYDGKKFYDDSEDWLLMGEAPTHWMPLPEPPKEAA